RLNDDTRNIMTVEDPIEYDLDGISQTQINTRIEMSFARALRTILRQDPEECFFAVLCASVAPIARIRGMLTAVATEFGVTGESDYTRFPEAGQLATASEVRLRELGLGFRARRIVEAASCLAILPQGEIAALRQASLKEAKERLTQFFGVGEKIADCICLFSLDKDGAIPVDTHIWRIARARYAPELAGKSLTPQNYAKVTAAFHRFFGDKAGWAQQILFYRQAVNRDDKARKTIK
ncbi:MAG: ATPase, T2SS/T4P/T4SS family, partial [bacterium]